jgi:hypothetical protein
MTASFLRSKEPSEYRVHVSPHRFHRPQFLQLIHSTDSPSTPPQAHSLSIMDLNSILNDTGEPAASGSASAPAGTILHHYGMTPQGVAYLGSDTTPPVSGTPVSSAATAATAGMCNLHNFLPSFLTIDPQGRDLRGPEMTASGPESREGGSTSLQSIHKVCRMELETEHGKRGEINRASQKRGCLIFGCRSREGGGFAELGRSAGGSSVQIG